MTKMSSLAAGLALALAAAGAAGAHAKLVSADPPVDGAAKAPPSNVDLLFSEPISVKLSGATIKDAAGQAVAASSMTEKAGKGLALMMNTPLKPGAYTVDWHAVASDDGHRTAGTYKFTVR